MTFEIIYQDFNAKFVQVLCFLYESNLWSPFGKKTPENLLDMAKSSITIVKDLKARHQSLKP